MSNGQSRTIRSRTSFFALAYLLSYPCLSLDAFVKKVAQCRKTQKGFLGLAKHFFLLKITNKKEKGSFGDVAFSEKRRTVSK